MVYRAYCTRRWKNGRGSCFGLVLWPTRGRGGESWTAEGRREAHARCTHDPNAQVRGDGGRGRRTPGAATVGGGVRGPMPGAAAGAGAGTESTAPVEVVAQGIDPRAAPCDSLGRQRTAVSFCNWWPSKRAPNRICALRPCSTTSRALFLRQTQ